MGERWTSREVEFTPYRDSINGTNGRLLDDAPDHFWRGWRRWLFGDLCLASHGAALSVSGWPWWVPPFLRRREVAAYAESKSATGEARAFTTLVVPTATTPTHDCRYFANRRRECRHEECQGFRRRDTHTTAPAAADVAGDEAEGAGT